VGAIAAWQRGYITQATQNCASAGTIAVTVIAGPLNYVGVNPKVTNGNVLTVHSAHSSSNRRTSTTNQSKEPT
jgi:hypothetical protein